MDGFLVALLVGRFGGLANLLIDIPARARVFCLLVSCVVWVFLAALVHGF